MRGLVVGTLLLALAGCAQPEAQAETPAAAGADPVSLVNQWTVLNSTCRGGSGNDPDTLSACDAREDVSDRLAAAGWCYGRPGEPSYKAEWHPSSEGCAGEAPAVAAPPAGLDDRWYVVDWRRSRCIPLQEELGVDTPEQAAEVLSPSDRAQSVVFGEGGVTALIGDPSGTTMGLARGLETCVASAKAMAAAG